MKRIVPSILVAIFPYMVVLYLCWIMNLLPVPFPANWTSASVYIVFSSHGSSVESARFGLLFSTHPLKRMSEQRHGTI